MSVNYFRIIVQLIDSRTIYMEICLSFSKLVFLYFSITTSLPSYRFTNIIIIPRRICNIHIVSVYKLSVPSQVDWLYVFLKINNANISKDPNNSLISSKHETIRWPWGYSPFKLHKPTIDNLRIPERIGCYILYSYKIKCMASKRCYSAPASLSSGKSLSKGIINYLLVTLRKIRFLILNGMYILHRGI